MASMETSSTVTPALEARLNFKPVSKELRKVASLKELISRAEKVNCEVTVVTWRRPLVVVGLVGVWVVMVGDGGTCDQPNATELV